MNRLALFVATGGYVGYVPFAPGTFGSALGLGLLWGMRPFGDVRLEIVVIVLVLVLGVWSGSVAERYAGRVDPGIVVIDEVAGMLITMLLIPVTVTSVFAGFLVFRALDIVKPWPARRLERLPGGFGIMADDVMAAVYGNLVMHGLTFVAAGWFR
jgi:phosphatidylglycerophosphatase A